MQASTTAAPEMTDPAIATLPLVAVPSMHLSRPARPGRKPVTPKGPAMKKVDGNRPNRTPPIPRMSAVGASRSFAPALRRLDAGPGAGKAADPWAGAGVSSFQ